MKPQYIIERIVLNNLLEPIKLGYYNETSSSCWLKNFPIIVDKKEEAKIFNSIETAQKTIEILKSMSFIRELWRYKYNILNYC